MTEASQSSAGQPERGSIAIQSVPPGASEGQAKRNGEAADRLSRETVRLDGVLAVGVIMLAFFVASFASPNTDVWMHLAAGRLIAQGQYTFGADPFAYTTAGTYWTNSNWLAELGMYGLVQALGGPEDPRGGAALVLAKALLFAAAAAVLLAIRRRQGLWASAVCVALAVVAISPRLLLQPTCISFLFLALTLYLIYPPENTTGQGSKKVFWLPLVFALWANLDGWFLLGPIVVGLYLLGQALQRTVGPRGDAPTTGELRRLAIVFIFGLAACLVNPHHLHALALPPEIQTLLTAGDSLRHDPGFASFFLSPLQAAFYRQVPIEHNAPVIAYAVLIVLGLISFALNWADWRWWRALVWLSFLVLSLALARAIPLFVLVAAPLTALNLQDFARRRFGRLPQADGASRAWSLGGRIASVVGVLALLALAWPGWLYVTADDARWSRRVAWRLPVDDSLKQAALRLADLRRDGIVAGHGFNYNADIANYCAWYCPEERGAFDYRYHLFDEETTEAFAKVRQGLSGRPVPAKDGGPAAKRMDDSIWQEILRDTRHPVDHVTVNGINGEVIVGVLSKLWLDPRQWTMLYVDGQTAIFGWADPRQPAAAERFARKRLDVNDRAFAGRHAEDARLPGPVAEAPRPRGLWDRFARGSNPRPLAVDEVTVWLRYAVAANQVAAVRALQRNLAQWFGVSAGAAVTGRGLLGTPAALFYQRYPSLLTQGPQPEAAAIPLLAVRAGWRAVAANPQDADAHLALGKALHYLWDFQRERWPGSTRLVDEIKVVQIVNAFRHALALRPDSAEAHFLLADVFSQLNEGDPRLPTHLDLALEHRKEGLRILREAGPSNDETQEVFERQLSAADESIKRLELSVQRRETDFQLKAERQPPVRKALLALERGLAGKALEILHDSDLTQLAPDEQSLLIRLMLRSGRIDEVSEAREILSHVGDKLLLAAGEGDYRRTDEYLAELQTRNSKGRLMQALMLAKLQPTPAPAHPFSFAGIGQFVDAAKQVADFNAVRGALALEAGQADSATRLFQQSLTLRISPKYWTAATTVAAADSPLRLAAFLAAYVTGGPRVLFYFDNAPMAAQYWLLTQEANGR